jgi:hypothetical protein
VPPASPEKKSDSSTIGVTSAIDAPATTTWPKGVDVWPASLRMGRMIPRPVAERMTATRSGDLTSPPSLSPSPTTRASPNDTAKPSEVTRSSRPRSRSNWISSPASSKRNARPNMLRTSIGPSKLAQPSTCGAVLFHTGWSRL